MGEKQYQADKRAFPDGDGSNTWRSGILKSQTSSVSTQQSESRELLLWTTVTLCLLDNAVTTYQLLRAIQIPSISQTKLSSRASSYLYKPLKISISNCECSVLLSNPSPRQSLHPQLLLRRFVHTI